MGIVEDCRKSFLPFLDFTWWWKSRNGYRLEKGDGAAIIAEALDQWRDFNVISVEAPRGAAKSTIFNTWDVYLHWLHPWLCSITISATPQVAEHSIRYMRDLCMNHPLLESIRPTRLDGSKESHYFDIPGRQGQHRSFLCRTMKGAYTGLRAHVVKTDDLEVRDTVRTEQMRREIRLAASEAQNLLFPGNTINLVANAGTPWDIMTYHREIKADRYVRIPAIDPPTIEALESGDCKVNFKALSLDNLRRRRAYLQSDAMFRTQYLLDTSAYGDEGIVNLSDIVYKDLDPGDVTMPIMVIDPAGDKDESKVRLNQVTGDVQRMGDEHAIVIAGLWQHTMVVCEVWSGSVVTSKFLSEINRLAKRWNVTGLYYDKTLNGWAHSFRSIVQQHNLRMSVKGVPCRGKKLTRICDDLRPLFGSRLITFSSQMKRADSARRQHHDKLVSQLMRLRSNMLPKPHDDLIDALSLATQQLGPKLKNIRPKSNGVDVRPGVPRIASGSRPPSNASAMLKRFHSSRSKQISSMSKGSR